MIKISGQYAEAGQKEKAADLLSLALTIVKTIEDANDKASALAEIAGQYAETGQHLSKADLAELRHIVHRIIPMGELWP